MQKKKMHVIFYIILWSLSFFQFNMILSYSAKPATISAAESQVISDKISANLDIIFGTKSNDRRLISIHPHVRKTAHIVVFFLFGFLNNMFFYYSAKGSCFKTLFLSLFIGICGAIIDECFQLFVDGRAGQFSDVLADTVGTSAACLLFLLMTYKFDLEKKGWLCETLGKGFIKC